MSNYGNEIAELSDIFVNVQDLEPQVLFALPEERIHEFLHLSRELLSLLKNDPSAEDAKHAAVLYDHLKILLHFNHIDIEELTSNTKELGDILASFVQKQMHTIQKHSTLDLSDSDQIQLSRLLKTGMQGASRIPLARLLLIMYRKLKRQYQLWIKQRKVKRMKQFRQKVKKRHS